MSKSTNVCHTGKIAVNKAAKLHHLFSRPKKSLNIFLPQYKIKLKKLLLSYQEIFLLVMKYILLKNKQGK